MNRKNLADNNGRNGLLKTIHSIRGVRSAASTVFMVAVLMVALNATAKAQCGDSLSAMASSAAAIRSQPQVSKSSHQHAFSEGKSLDAETATASDNAVKTSIVGLWHIRFLVEGQEIQEAFQIWNTGGTEVHNPKVDPKNGTICLGTWEESAPQTYNLTHRVWLWDNGVFHGTIHMNETLVLGNRGNTHSGSFTLDFFDPDGNFLFEVPGTVVGERISVH